MTETSSRAVRHGASAGVAAGVLFATFQVLGALALGRPWLLPFREFASVVLGGAAMDVTAVNSLAAIIAGSLVHVGLSAAFGGLYGGASSGSSLENRTGWGRQLAIGGLFGVLLWIVDYQLIARNFYPWFLAPPQALELVLHVATFGMPLGLLFAGLQRRPAASRQRRAT